MLTPLAHMAFQFLSISYCRKCIRRRIHDAGFGRRINPPLSLSHTERIKCHSCDYRQS